jgi:hypothetical protein
MDYWTVGIQSCVRAAITTPASASTRDYKYYKYDCGDSFDIVRWLRSGDYGATNRNETAGD